MKNKILGFLAIILLLSTPAFASVGWKANGTPHGAMENFDAQCPSGGDCTTQSGLTRKIPVLDQNLFATGTANGASTSLASTTTAVPTAYAYVRKVITNNNDPLYTVGTLANGKPNQILTISIDGISPSASTGSWTLSPTTVAGFTSIKFTAINDKATFIYLPNSGWAIVSTSGSITINR